GAGGRRARRRELGGGCRRLRDAKRQRISDSHRAGAAGAVRAAGPEAATEIGAGSSPRKQVRATVPNGLGAYGLRISDGAGNSGVPRASLRGFGEPGGGVKARAQPRKTGWNRNVEEQRVRGHRVAFPEGQKRSKSGAGRE